MTEATITIPLEPPREVNPNWHGHWNERRRAVKLWREAAWFATYGSLRMGEIDSWRGQRTVIMDVEIAWGKGRRILDDDNAWASMKGARDGIADALFEGEDRYIVQGTLTQRRGTGETLITLRIPEGVLLRDDGQYGGES